VTTVSCGGHHTAAVLSDGEVYTCGDGSCGQLGHLTGDSQLSFKHVAALEGRRVVQVRASSLCRPPRRPPPST